MPRTAHTPLSYLTLSPLAKFSEPSSLTPSVHSTLIQKSKDFRLASLQLSPTAFASTYEAESAFPDRVWLERLCDPRVTRVILIDRLKGDEMDVEGEDAWKIAVEREWIGQIILVQTDNKAVQADQSPGANDDDKSSNPSQSQTYQRKDTEVKDTPDSNLTSSSEGHSPAVHDRKASADSDTLHFTINGLFLLPTMRSHGIGSHLVSRAVSAASAIAAKHAKHWRIVILVYADNKSAITAYLSCGFIKIRHEIREVIAVGRAVVGMELTDQRNGNVRAGRAKVEYDW